MAKIVRAQPLGELRKRKSLKWRYYEKEVLPLPVAEMDFPIAEPIKNALRDMIDRSDTGYLGPFPELFESFRIFSNELWDWNPDVSQMRTATDVGVGVVEVMRTLIQPGDKVLLNSPIYDNMWRWVTEVKAELIDVPLKRNQLEYSLDLEAIESAYRTGVKVHLLCSPHNPVGTVFDRESLSKLAELAKHYQVIVISDEIHAPLTFVERKFIPFLNVSDAAREIGITVTSASKTFNLAGLKCALIITENVALKEKINAMPISVGYRASLFGAVAATSAMSECSEWLAGVLLTLDENRKLIKKIIDTKIPSIGYRIPDFGYLAWLDLTALGLGDDPAKVLLERGKLAVNGGHMYGPEHSSFIRFNFGTSPEIITEAFERILQTNG
ncbi:MAG: aminotransferase class I/II-fold pyridoxal phosphate-dependent enzyme [Actinomycetales bacterium]|nr:aminotransferase class I/II-fold pyridoxal phosphate-dependent enzyme [Actinomycetales bacterium]